MVRFQSKIQNPKLPAGILGAVAHLHPTLKASNNYSSISKWPFGACPVFVRKGLPFR
jgi:hypothetical protein